MGDQVTERETAPSAGVDPRGLELGTRMGRYQLVAVVGAGGMGVVFSARDPELDRTVALKILKPSRGPASVEGELRLRREGQTMARVAHPNVIRVYDVGVAQGNLFVAMEYIAGGTLQDWLERAPRSPDEIVAVFAQAGRGLAAAHAAGLVHRDFKPSNVLVGDDGRVLVTDFGLARASGDPAPITGSGDTPSSPIDTITRAGLHVGTPAFMAPEQHAGKPVDARADQFSFCVALWRALYGVAPYPGRSLEELALSTSLGEPAPPPAETTAKVPPWLRAALERGLEPDPLDRFASMDALLAALVPAPARLRRIEIAIAAALALAIAALVAWLILRPAATDSAAAADPCATAADPFAGVWDADAARAVHAAFAATGVAYREAAFHEVSRQLDLRRHAWEAMRRDSCAATRVRHAQSETMMDVRAVCLDHRLDDLAAFVAELRKADADTVKGAAQQAGSIGDVTACADLGALARKAPLPDDPARRAAIEAVERDLAVARARFAAGHPRDVVALADPLIARARQTGYAPALVEALQLAAAVQAETDHAEQAEPLLEQAELAAEAGGDDALRFDCEAELIRIDGYLLERDADANRHAQRAEALLTRLGADPRRAATLARNRAIADWWNGRLPDAHARADEAVALLEKIDPDGGDLAKALHMRAIVEQDQGDSAASAATERAALVIGERAFGADHPSVAQLYETEGGSLRNLHRLPEARAALERGLAILEETSGPDSEVVAAATMNLGLLAEDEGNPALAVETLEHALAITEKAMGPDHSRVADVLESLGEPLDKVGRTRDAEAAFTRAMAIHRARVGPDAPATASSTRHLAELYLAHGHASRARPLFAEAVRALEASQGKTSRLLAQPLAGLADADLALGHGAAAAASYERALALAGDDPQSATFRVTTAASLARARKQAP